MLKLDTIHRTDVVLHRQPGRRRSLLEASDASEGESVTSLAVSIMSQTSHKMLKYMYDLRGYRRNKALGLHPSLVYATNRMHAASRGVGHPERSAEFKDSKLDHSFFIWARRRSSG